MGHHTAVVPLLSMVLIQSLGRTFWDDSRHLMGPGLLRVAPFLVVFCLSSPSLLTASTWERSHYYRPPKKLWSVPPTWAQGKADATCVDTHLDKYPDAHLDVHLDARSDGGEFGLRFSCHHFTTTNGETGTVGREGMP